MCNSPFVHRVRFIGGFGLFLVMLLAIAVPVPVTHAAPLDLSNNLGNTNSGAHGINTSQNMAQAFTTTATHTRVTTVVLPLCYDHNPPFTGNFAVEIWDATGAGGRPGAFVATVAANQNATSVPSDSDPNCPTTYTSYAGLTIALSASTSYYVVVRNVSLTGSILWRETINTAGTGFPSNKSIFSAGSWGAPSMADPQRMQVVADTNYPIYSSVAAPGSTIALGATTTGTAVTTNLVVNNLGGAQLDVTASNISGANAADFGITAGGAPFNIASGGASRTITIRCLSNITGSKTATLSITHNATGSPATYTLTCTVNAPVAPTVVPRAPADVPEGDTLLLLGGGIGGLGVWLRYQWSKRRAK